MNGISLRTESTGVRVIASENGKDLSDEELNGRLILSARKIIYGILPDTRKNIFESTSNVRMSGEEVSIDLDTWASGNFQRVSVLPSSVTISGKLGENEHLVIRVSGFVDDVLTLANKIDNQVIS